VPSSSELRRGTTQSNPRHDPTIASPLEIVRIEAFAVRFPYDVLDRPDVEPGPSPYKVGEGRLTIYPTQVETLLVRLEAADGTVGWGEALVPVGVGAVKTLVDELLAPAVLGRDATELAALQARLVATMRERGHVYGHQADAVTAVDIAVHDLVGRHHGLPIAALLGGAVRWELPTYCTGLSGAADNAERASDLWDEGWQRFKIHSVQGWRADVAAVERVRSALPEAEVALDVHGTYRVPEAVRAGRVLDTLDAWFLESALAPEDVHGHAAIAAAITTPVAAGEAMRHRSEVMTVIREKALDVLQPDIGRTGVSEGRAITMLADVAGMPVLPHHSAALGIALVAGLHVAAAAPTLEAFEFPVRAVELSSVVLTEPLSWKPGIMECPRGPGLGVEVNEEAVRRWAGQRSSAA